MLTTIQGNLYDYPKYYDLVYGSDWEAEFEFLQDCFDRHALVPVKRVFEPACGTGRLLAKLAQAGYEVGGVDLNEKAVTYCNRRLKRIGVSDEAIVGDMCKFITASPVDAAFNTINSFRHLLTESEALRHLQVTAQSLLPGGIYLLGLDLTPSIGEPMQEESWSARRGNLAVMSRLWVIGYDQQLRRESVGMSFDVYTPTKQFRIEDQVEFRTYSHRQLKSLFNRVPEFDLIACYDFGYNIEEPIEMGPETEDVVCVLRKRPA